MTPRQARLGVDVFTGTVIASVALALAGLTWRLQGEPGVGPTAAPVSPGRGLTSDIRPLLALAPFGTVVTVASPTGGEGSVTLKGIFLARPMAASVVLLATADGKVASYGIGSAVGGGVIETIDAEQITLRTAGGVQVIGFTPISGAVAASTPAAFNASTFAPPSAAPVQPVLGVDAVRALIPSSAQGLPRSTPPPTPPPLPPVSVAPRQSGLTIGAAPPPALAAAGIRPGDVIQRVNGRTVNSGTNERELMSSALNSGTARVELLRNGQRVLLTIPVQ